MDLIKHVDYFNPVKIAGKDVLVIGVGSLGSNVLLQLAKLGIDNIIVMDDDVVEEHNISNQPIYGPADVGVKKINAAYKSILDLTNIVLRASLSEKAGNAKLYDEIVFCCVDSMQDRSKIFNDCIAFNLRTELYLEARVSATHVMCYCFDSRRPKYIAAYRDTLYDDSTVPKDIGNCGITQSIGATAALAANILVWMFMQHLNDKITAHEVILTTQDWKMHSRKFD